ncbi:MAG: methyltransferase domain-containing protein [Myxococcota bacterium]
MLKLDLTEAGAKCSECRRQGGVAGGIAVLCDDPVAMLEDWGRQRAAFVADTRATADAVLAQLAGQDLHARTRARLELVYDRMVKHGTQLNALFERAGVKSVKEKLSLEARVPGEGVATAYFDQVHRDWGWNDESDEPGAALEAVMSVVGDARPSTMLVLGAGACRLPYDLHCRLNVSTTIAVDINPVPFFIARRLIAGETEEMVEFPRSPRDSEHAAVDRTLACPNPGVDGFHFLFADGLAPPVPDASFDAVFTPWFIDQVPKDLRTLLPEIHRVLRPGGVWINHGPLLFHPSHTPPSARYREDELYELMEDAGFEVDAKRWDRLLYMQSPAGSQGRTEGVLSFAARKVALRSTIAEEDARPAWLDDPVLRIPRWSELDDYTAPHPMFAAVASLVDGARSASAIADEMVRRFNLPADAALGGVMTCLLEMWRARHANVPGSS